MGLEVKDFNLSYHNRIYKGSFKGSLRVPLRV